MKLLFCGDVVGRSGRQVIEHYIPLLRKELALDFVIVNGENAAGGIGITKKICEQFYESGVDVITSGNHIWDQREIINYIDQDNRLLRPLTYPQGTPGAAYGLYTLSSGLKIFVVNIMGQLFMPKVEDPFRAIQNLLNEYKLKEHCDFIFIDFHGETTSEKAAFAYFVDGQVSAVVGTHTHVPTADHRLLPKGTAFLSDVGMCGDYQSVIGMRKDLSLQRFLTPINPPRLLPAEGEGTLCAVFLELDDASGLPITITPIRLGGALSPAYVL